MANVSIPEGSHDLPKYPWYSKSDDTTYPQPEDGVDGKSHHWMMGWEHGIDQKPALQYTDDFDGKQAYAYYSGYSAAVQWSVAHGVDPFKGEELLKSIPPAVPADDPILPTAAEVVLPPIPFGKTAIWLEGWQDAFNLRDQKQFPKDQSHGTAAEYREGFHSGVEWLVDENRISINVGRKMLGLAYGQEFRSQMSDDELEGFIPTPASFDPVKIPAHYNTGKIEVANFIADQRLPYPMDNIIKYVCRAGKKEGTEELQDLEKAAAYLQMAYNIANGLPAVVRDPETNEVVWTLFKN